MRHFLSDAFGSPRISRRRKETAGRRARRRSQAAIGFQEVLETRRAFAVGHFAINGPSILPGAGEAIETENGLHEGRSWVTIVSDGGDSIYAQQISPATPGQAEYVPSLIYGNNASFLGFGEVSDINSYTDVFVTNASIIRNVEQLGGVLQDSDGYPFNAPGTPQANFSDRSLSTTFVLPTDDVDEFELITGEITNGVGGVWSFTNTPGRFGHSFNTAAFTPIGVPTGPNPRSAFIVSGRDDGISSGEFDALFIVTWDTNSLAPGGMSPLTPPELRRMTYDYIDDDGRLGFELVAAPRTEASSPSDPLYRLPLSPSVPINQPVYEVAPGTLRGILNITQYGVRYEFTTLTQFPVDDPLNVNGMDSNVVRAPNGVPVLNAAGQPVRQSTLAFRRIPDAGNPLPWRAAGLFQTIGPDDDDGNDARLMTGTLTYVQDINPAGNIFYRPAVQLNFLAVDDLDDSDLIADLEPVEATEESLQGPQEVGRVTVDATFAVFNEPEQFKGGNFTFFDGHDFSRNLTVDLLAPGATISIETPILFDPAGAVDENGQTIATSPLDSPAGHFIDLRAANTYLQAQMWSGTSFTLRDSLAGRAKAEQVFVNAANAASTYDIRVSDDPLTDNVRRSKVFVSTTGSLAGLLPTAPDIFPKNANSLFVRSHTGDVFIEGTVAADYQSYLMQSPAEFADQNDSFGTANRAPYYLTTQSMISGAITGRVRGLSLAVTLGNDTPTMYDDTRNGGSSAFNVVTLQTEVDSIRIQASDRAGNPLETPFPYDLWVSELDKLRVDAVAASSLPLAVYANDDISWNATLLSAGDVTVESIGGDMDLNAPLNTTFGSISLAADRLSVRNSVRVLDTFNDDSSLSVNDITLTARNGDLLLTGPISAVNTVELIQSGTGSISGDSRIIADRVLVRAAGTATIKTQTEILAGSASAITVDEQDALFVDEFSVSSGYISLVANGTDTKGTFLNDEGEAVAVTIPALRAVLPDARTLVVSAPRGSVDVRLTNADKLMLGDGSRISARTAASMMAAGDVFIESAGGSIDVLDAPYATSSAIRVRVATTQEITGVYAQRTPGTFPATLTADRPGALVVDGIALRARELVLVKNQGNGVQNGIYQVVSPGGSNARWVLRRVPTLDQSAEVPELLRVSVNEGTQAGKTFQVAGYDNEVGATPRAVATVLNSFAAIEVRAVSTNELQADFAFDPVAEAWTLTSSVDALIPLFDGVRPGLGDLVLVRMGTRNLANEATRASNGVYTVSNVGSNLSPWQLTAVPELSTGIFKASEGSLAAKRTGNAFSVSFDSLGEAEMLIEEVNAFTKIGSRDVNDVVTFTTSTNLGTNDAVGSLGKMITLFNQNSYVNEPDLDIDPDGEPLPQNQSFAFAGNIGGPIRLTQELPRITRTITIDGTPAASVTGSLVTVDGSRIRTNRDWSTVEASEAFNGFEFYTAGPAANANQSRLVGIAIGGFTRGAAISLNNADDILIKDVQLGSISNSLQPGVVSGVTRLANKIGIEVVGDAGGFNTVLNSGIYASSQTGIHLAGQGQVRVVGSQIGTAGRENTIGVDVTAGTMLFGLLPSNTSLRRIAGRIESETSFSVPATIPAIGSLYSGLGISSTAIDSLDGFIAASVESISDPDPVTNRVTISIRNGRFNNVAGATAAVGFGAYTTLTSGSRQIPLPVGVRPEEVFLGQTITGTGIPGGTTIVMATADSLWLSSPATLTSDPGTTVAVLLGTPGRNVIAQNGRGIVIRGGTTTIVSSDVSNSVFDGVLVAPTFQSAAATAATIGGNGARTGMGGRNTGKDLAFASNAIFGNGGAGVRVNVAAANSQVIVQGNRLGLTRDGASNINKAGNIVAPASFFGPIQGTFTENLLTASFRKLNATSRSILIEHLNPHGLSQGDPVRLRMPTTTGGTVDAVFTVARIETANQFTVTLTAQQWSQLASTGNASRVQHRVTLPEAHALKTGQLLWLEFVSRNGQPGSLQDARKIVQMPGAMNAFLVEGLAGTPATGSVFVNRYGRQVGGDPVAHATQLRRTNQIDYSGNVHGLSSAVASATGGVVSVPNATANPTAGQVRAVRPPVRR